MKKSFKEKLFENKNLTLDEKIDKYYDHYSKSSSFVTKKGKQVEIKSTITFQPNKLRQDMSNGKTKKDIFRDDVKLIMEENGISLEKAINRRAKSSRFSDLSPEDSYEKEKIRILEEIGIVGKNKKGVNYFLDPQTKKFSSVKEAAADLKYIQSGSVNINGKTLSYTIREFRGLYYVVLWSPSNTKNSDTFLFSSLKEAKKWLFGTEE